MASNQIKLLENINYDFDALTQELVDRVSKSDTWKDTYRSSTGQMLIELYSYVANMILYSIERRVEESYIGTAQHKSSIVNLVRLIGYMPKRIISSTGVLKFYLDTAYDKKIYIPKLTKVATESGLEFVTLEDVVMLEGQTSITVRGKQGVAVKVIKNGNGQANFSITIEDTVVENDSIEVVVNGEEWEQVTSFAYSTANDKHYTVTTNIDETVTIYFGDGDNGKIVEEGYVVEVNYLKSKGINGNVYQTNKIVKINSTLYNNEGVDVTDKVKVTNEDIFIGGDAPEDIEEIRAEAPRVFKTGDRAVTKSDHITILKNTGGVADANVWGEAEMQNPDFTMRNKVKLAVLMQEWIRPSNTKKEELSAILYEKGMLTVHYEFVDVDIVDVISSVKVKAERGYPLSVVEDNVKKTLSDLFVLGDTTSIGANKRHSDMVKEIENTEGVSYHYLYNEIERDLIANYDSNTDYGVKLPLLEVEPSTVKIYVDDDVVAIDDGNGNLTDTSSAYTVSGTINYTDGELKVNISPSLSAGSRIYARYMQMEEGDLVVGRDQVLRLKGIIILDISYA